MTKEEEASKTLTQYIDYDAETPDYYEMEKACKVAIKALEQEPTIDKIRAEIIDTGAYEQEVNGKTEFLKGINYCLCVIDKYKAESEDKK